MTARSALSGLLAIAVTGGGCATTDTSRTGAYRGASGPVSWEIVGISTRLASDQRRIEWHYTVILRDTGGRGVEFERIETSTEGGDHPDSLMGSVHERPFPVRLAPLAEYRYSTSYSITFVPAAGGGFGEVPGGHRGVTVRYRLFGREATGQSVVVTIPVSLSQGSGSHVRVPMAPGPSVAPSFPPAAPAPVPARMPARTPPANNPAWEVARECTAKVPGVQVVAIGETGGLEYEFSAPGEDRAFDDCYQTTLNDRLQGRLVSPPDAPRRTTVAIQLIDTSFTVEATIGGATRARLLVDTGASLTVLRPRLVERVAGAASVEGLRRTLIVATGDQVTVSLARLPSLAVGDFTVEGLHVAVYDVMPQASEIDGFLGTDFLHRFGLWVDSASRQLTLERRP